MSVRRSLVVSISLVMLFLAPGSAFAGGGDIIDPFVTITTPTSLAHYQLNQVVNANYFCSDTGGSGLSTCTGPVPSGSPIDTSYYGYHIFNVVAYDNAGNSSNAANGYFVVSDAKPDARIRRIGRTNLVGDDIYNDTAAGQEVNAKFSGAAIRRFVISIQNDGPTPHSFTVMATGISFAGYAVSFHQGHPGTDITAAVTAGTYTTPMLAPGAIHRIRVYVSIGAVVGGSGITRLVTVKSAVDFLTVDAVRFNIGTLDPCLATCV